MSNIRWSKSWYPRVRSWAKINNSVELDNLPNEILKNQSTIEVLVILFQKIFTSSIVPTIWKTGIIKAIPKSSLIDPRVPLQYGGISLLSTVYKISSVLNKCIVNVADTKSTVC